MAVMGMPAATAAETVALECDYRHGDSRLVRQRSQIVLLGYEMNSQEEIATVMRCSRHTVLRTLQLYRQGGRSALRTALRSKSSGQRTDLAWQKALAEAMRLGPQACGVPRPTWTAPLLAEYLAKKTDVVVGEHTVRRGLALLGYVCRRPTWTVRHKAEEQPDYGPKELGSRRS